ncbi:cation:proton antiporter [Paenibacillus sp. S150]|uniref:cation:proton antiporter n=1 Tax=Paenibacillus sp. S150 TaxID=2749826 RepID=UPI001C583DE5|nr:cation:proton antiporter [Paenibacillus sp. S150]MBW4082417.1 cation:proton antiporter [Paenibacillus sp. S150]
MFHIDSSEITRFFSALILLLLCANTLGFIAERLFIPRVIGEVAGGLILGPTFIGQIFPDFYTSLFLGFESEGQLFGLIYQLGLILLMFHTGLKFHTRLKREDGKIALSLIIASTTLPFLAGWLFSSMFNINQFLGSSNNPIALQIVISISIAVTSIPVISKIFLDLGIAHSRFAKIVIFVAGIHDVILWIALAIASGMVSSEQTDSSASLFNSLGVTVGFMLLCLLVIPFLLRAITMKKANFLYRSSFLGYFILILLILSAASGYLGVDMMFGALLSGIAIKMAFPEELCEKIESSIKGISFSFFIPLYFSIVGLGLNLVKDFDILFFLIYLVFTLLVQGIVVYATCRLIHCDRLTSMNFAVSMNARGGPCIVLATVTYSQGIINEEFFCILIILALVTSWFAGSWLKYVLKNGWKLMPGDETITISEGKEQIYYQTVPLENK